MIEGLDPRKLTFSQAQGYEELPQPLKLEELSSEARTHIWNVLYASIDSSMDFDRLKRVRTVGGVWEEILFEMYSRHYNLPIDEWNNSFEVHRGSLRNSIKLQPFNKVFDLVQFILRHPSCPYEVRKGLKEVFVSCRLAYTIDEEDQPTIFPAVTEAEGNTIIESLRTLRRAGLNGNASHLRKASDCINAKDWAGSIRESIHAVESVARQLDPEASATLGAALASIEKRNALHPALKEAFSKLYGYTSNEQGIRHALLDRHSADVGMNEALFMLGACASFASYLWRKYATGEA